MGAKKRRWWQRCKLADARYVSFEDQASSITEFQLGRIPALLQTEAYARSANRNRRSESQTSDSNPFVLMPRQERLFGDSPLALHALVHEPVLHQVGTDEPDELDVAYAQTAFGRIQSEDDHMTAHVRQMLSQLARDALGPDESLALLKRLAGQQELAREGTTRRLLFRPVPARICVSSWSVQSLS